VYPTNYKLNWLASSTLVYVMDGQNDKIFACLNHQTMNATMQKTISIKGVVVSELVRVLYILQFHGLC